MPRPGEREAVLATWHHLIDEGSLLDGDDVLAGTARPPLVRIGKDLAETLGVAEGDAVTVSTERGGDHAAGRDHRPAPAGGVASHQLAGLDRASQPRRHFGCGGPALRRPAGADPRRGGNRMNSMILAQAEDPTLPFHDVWWISLIKLVGVFVILLLLTLFTINYERKVVARMAVRPGPNQVGPKGWFQSLTDGLKLPFKEEIIPKTADKVVYFLAPVISAVRPPSPRSR